MFESAHMLILQSNFFMKHFDIDGDGLISFHEYLLIVTLLSIPLKVPPAAPSLLHRGALAMSCSMPSYQVNVMLGQESETQHSCAHRMQKWPLQCSMKTRAAPSTRSATLQNVMAVFVSACVTEMRNPHDPCTCAFQYLAGK